jgi:hypothetical protein
MFSDHLRKIDDAPHKTLLLVAAGLVMACQLVAMALVAGEQVQKAQMRGDSHASRQVMVASCVESSRGAAVKDCFRLGIADLEIRQDADGAKSFVQLSSSEAAELDTIVTPATSAGALAGFMSASFAVR